MNVTEVTITRQPDQEEHDQRLLGYANITLDGVFAVRDIKIVDGPQGRFVAMPSRKIMDHCPGCGGKNRTRTAKHVPLNCAPGRSGCVWR